MLDLFVGDQRNVAEFATTHQMTPAAWRAYLAAQQAAERERLALTAFVAVVVLLVGVLAWRQRRAICASLYAGFVAVSAATVRRLRAIARDIRDHAS